MESRDGSSFRRCSRNRPGGLRRFSFREVATIVGVVFTATGVMIAGMQWAISININPLYALMGNMQSQILAIHDELGHLRGLYGGIRDELGELRGLPA